MSSICRVISADEATAVCFSLEEGMVTESKESFDRPLTVVLEANQNMAAANAKECRKIFIESPSK